MVFISRSLNERSAFFFDLKGKYDIVLITMFNGVKEDAESGKSSPYDTNGHERKKAFPRIYVGGEYI